MSNARFKFAEKVRWSQRARGLVEPTDREKEDALAIGGLRDTAHSVSRLHLVETFGAQLGQQLRHLVSTGGTEGRSWIGATMEAIGSTDPEAGPPPEAVAAVRSAIESATGIPTCLGGPRLTNVDARLLEAWRKAAGHPDTSIGPWMLHGAPTGILNEIPDPGIFPRCDRPASAQPSDLYSDERSFQNYPGVEDAEVTATELQAHLDKGHIVGFESYDELAEFVQGRPVLSKLGLILKTRNNITKARLILDTKESGIKLATSQWHRVILPRLYDAILQLPALLALPDGSEKETIAASVEALVLDFSDAYWQIPIRKEEQRFFCATSIIDGKRIWFAFQRAAQGSAAAGQLWGRLASAVMILTQSLFAPQDVRLVCYVDDPLAAVRGTTAERKLNMTIMILVWAALGFKLAFAKGQAGRTISWIGGTFTIHSSGSKTTGVTATVKDSIVSDIMADLEAMLAVNIVTKKALHSLIGKLSHAAGLLIIMRPFLDPLWAAWAQADMPNLRGRVWVRAIRTELKWCHSFFSGSGLSVKRFFSVDAYCRRGTKVEIGTDASPWGLGGYLMVNDTLTRYFACPLSDDDLAKYKLQRGDPKGQQLWEALAVLVAVDLWSKMCPLERIILSVKSDNVAALTLLVKMRPPAAHDANGVRIPSTTMAVVARELAMRLIIMSFPPDPVHTPGVGHIIADRLSRVHAPDGEKGELKHLHPALLHATADTVPPRTAEWYKT